MRGRGYGCGKRTNFSIYTFGARDRLLLAITFTVAARMQTSYTPDLLIADGIWTTIGCIAYMIFLAVPMALNILEEITWHILRSRI